MPTASRGTASASSTLGICARLATGLLWAISLGGPVGLPAQTLGEALGQPGLAWASSGWTVQTNETHDGVAAATSGVSALPTYAWIRTQVAGPGAMRFFWKSDVPVGDYLEFSLDGTSQVRVAGVAGWQQRAVALPAGTSTAQWSFNATSGSTANANAVWLDEVGFGPPSLPQVSVLPLELSVGAGDTATVVGTASGPEPWTFAWQFNGTNLPAATNAMLTIADAQAGAAGNYTLTVSNLFGAVTSQVAVLTVRPTAPVFTVQPLGARVLLGSNATFTAAAQGTEPMRWQWYHGDTPVPGASGTSLALTNIQTADAGEYRLWATNAAGTNCSNAARLQLILAPEFTLQPISQGAATGASIVLEAAVVASAPPAWQWFFNGAAIAGATNAQVTIADLGALKYGDYWAVAANGYGSATSTVAPVGYSPLIAWGEKTCGAVALRVPALSNVVAISGGLCHSLALLADGSVRAWGANLNGQCIVPPDVTNVVGIVAGYGNSVALRSDGTLAAWGLPLAPSGPAAATNLVGLASACAVPSYTGVRADGTALGWDNTSLLAVPPAATNVLRVAQSTQNADGHTYDGLFLQADGRLVGTSTVAASVTNVVDIDGSWGHYLALRADGSLVAWGDNTYGQLNVPAAATNILAIACGGTHCLALHEGGRLFAWGSNPDGELNIPPWATNLVAISGAAYGSLALVGNGPPRITAQPVSLPAGYGDTFRFLARAVGAPPLQLQWLQDGEPISGATKPWLLLSNLTSLPTASYALLASNSLGMATSRVVRVQDLVLAPRCLSPAQSVKAQAGSPAVLTALFQGAPPLSYSWMVGAGTVLTNSNRISGADLPRLTIRQFQSSDAGQYYLQASNAWGLAQAPGITLAAGTTAEVLLQALNQPGGSSWFVSPATAWAVDCDTTHDGFTAARLTAAQNSYTRAGGGSAAAAVSFWWKVSSETNGDWLSFRVNSALRAQISGEVDWQFRSFALPNLTSQIEWRYTKNGTVTNGQDCAWLDQVVLGPGIPPSLSRQPAGGVVRQGSKFTLSAEAAGTEPFTWLWQRDGVAVGSPTNSVLTLTNAQATNAGNYRLIVTNAFGAVTSQVARLEVQLNQPLLAHNPDRTISIKWTTGTLESAPTPVGPWTPVGGATTEFVISSENQSRFFRVRQ